MIVDGQDKICHAQEQGRAFICARTDDCGRCHGCTAGEARLGRLTDSGADAAEDGFPDLLLQHQRRSLWLKAQQRGHRRVAEALPCALACVRTLLRRLACIGICACRFSCVGLALLPPQPPGLLGRAVRCSAAALAADQVVQRCPQLLSTRLCKRPAALQRIFSSIDIAIKVAYVSLGGM